MNESNPSGPILRARRWLIVRTGVFGRDLLGGGLIALAVSALSIGIGFALLLLADRRVIPDRAAGWWTQVVLFPSVLAFVLGLLSSADEGMSHHRHLTLRLPVSVRRFLVGKLGALVALLVGFSCLHLTAIWIFAARDGSMSDFLNRGLLWYDSMGVQSGAMFCLVTFLAAAICLPQCLGFAFPGRPLVATILSAIVLVAHPAATALVAREPDPLLVRWILIYTGITVLSLVVTTRLLETTREVGRATNRTRDGRNPGRIGRLASAIRITGPHSKPHRRALLVSGIPLFFLTTANVLLAAFEYRDLEFYLWVSGGFAAAIGALGLSPLEREGLHCHLYQLPVSPGLFWTGRLVALLAPVALASVVGLFIGFVYGAVDADWPDLLHQMGLTLCVVSTAATIGVLYRLMIRSWFLCVVVAAPIAALFSFLGWARFGFTFGWSGEWIIPVRLTVWPVTMLLGIPVVALLVAVSRSPLLQLSESRRFAVSLGVSVFLLFWMPVLVFANPLEIIRVFF